MKNSDLRLDRLLRAAAQATNNQPGEMPFGFDTRALARWRASADLDFIDVGHLLGRVVLLSLAVIAISSVGAYHELQQIDDFNASVSDEYAIADSAIGSAFEE